MKENVTGRSLPSTLRTKMLTSLEVTFPLFLFLFSFSFPSFSSFSSFSHFSFFIFHFSFFILQFLINLNHKKDVQDIPKKQVDSIREWYKVYKTADGKPPNRYLFEGEAKGRDFALQIIKECHENWQKLRNEEKK